ncbi:hypothetical protein CQW23_31975 [Capsicum baccatum]|uniref:Uncharacterized protein n=1 Tax=Capsicum baccatum TaxID=33114 RepID=A0A2G2V681_CAPBA|nr:hypothetical protein CQW23_31975 [Capsicum baccatum]
MKRVPMKLSRANLDLLKNIELLMEDLKHSYLKAPDSCQWSFPMNDGPLFMHLLHIHLKDLLDSHAYSVALIKEKIWLVKEDLEFIRSFIASIDEELCKDLWARVLDVAYEAKDVIDSIIVRDNGVLNLIFSLPVTIQKVRLIKEDVTNLLDKIPKNRSRNAVNSPKNPVESKSFTGGKVIVGFKEETNWLISKLTSGPKDLDVISITGMPGSGKTTLAFKVYNDDSVCSHFDLRAWCTVDQEYEEKSLLVKLFNQVTGSDLKFSEDIDVADMLRRQLYGKRYLIVLDDVWDTSTWDDLTKTFPEVKKGSRIVLTTRLKEVAFHGKGNTDPLNLRLLRLEESLEKKRAVWLEVRNNLNSFILNSEVDVMKVIELSYDHLPHHMKPCFLYLASFPKDSKISRDKLKMFWRAEGLVEQIKIKSLEEVMEIYLENLISSSLVTSLNEIGDFPTCQIHDLVHDFCLIKARAENLFGKISSSDPSFSSSDLMPRIVTINYDKEHFGPNNFILLDSKMERHSSKHLYSFLISGDKMKDRLSDTCHLRGLRLLRVLLLIGTEVKSLPSSFSNPWNLETLWVDNEESTWVLLPRIWDLIKLRVLSIKACSFFEMDTNEPILIAEDSKLEKLRVLESLVLSHSKETEDIFIRFPNLQRLRFVLQESWDYSTERYWFPKLDYLTELELLIEEEWKMGEEDTFVNLKYLELEEVTLAKWEFGEESFPVLEKLLLLGCRKLTEIPPNFGDIGSLKIIQLDESPQLEDSAMEIKQYVEDIRGEDKLQILGPNNIPLSKTSSSLLFFCLETKFTRVVYNVFDKFSTELLVNVK